MLDALDEPLRIPKLDLALWVLLIGVSAAAVVGTVKASNALAASYKSNVSKIENAQKALDKVAKPDKSGNRPNEALIKQAKTARTNLNKQLLELWKRFYERQAQALVWPPGYGIEVSPQKPDEEIAAHLRKTYNGEIVPREFERMFAKLDLRRAKAAAGGVESGGPFASRPADFDGLVAWNPRQREALIARHVRTKGGPSSERVRLIQEDLWLYESLVDALEPLNEGARDSLSAPLKQIDVLDVAQGAVLAAQQRPTSIWTPAAAEQPAPDKPPKPFAVPAGDASDEAFLSGRYLDENGQPLAAGAKQPYAEFKQVFVYLKVVVDQRRMHELLARLANAALPVEIREVVIETAPDRTVREVPLADDGTPAPTSSVAKPPSQDPLAIAETTPWDTTVQIGGVVYLYHPPNAKKLGRGAAGSPGDRGFRVPSSAAAAKE